jgi:hypothetical protein
MEDEFKTPVILGIRSQHYAEAWHTMGEQLGIYITTQLWRDNSFLSEIAMLIFDVKNTVGRR